MPAPLPRAWSLITDSWNAFVKHWDTTVRYSAWFIPATVLQVMPLMLPNAPVFTVLGLVSAFAGIAVMIWASLSLCLVLLALEKGEKVTEKTTVMAWTLIPSLLLIALLQGIATLGGLILLILPGIYVGVRLSFSQLSLASQNLRGRAALMASWELTKNRFWAIVGREALAGFLFFLFMLVVMMTSMMIVELVGGRAVTIMLSDPENNTGMIVRNIVVSIVQAALIPAIVTFQVKLYLALKKAK